MRKGVVVVVAFTSGVLLVGGSGCGVFDPTSTTTSTTTTLITTTTTTEPAASWQQLQPSGESPSPRCYQAMVYDSTSGKVIMFGGFDGTFALSETWAYEPIGNSWSNVGAEAQEQPSAGGQIPAVYHPDTGRVIAFDGTSWGYDPLGRAWAALNPQGQKLKPARLGACMAYDSGGKKAYFFGGTDLATWYNETWAYDPTTNTWAKLEPTGEVPPGRSDAGMAYDPVTKKIILFGGIDANFTCLSDTWTYDPTTNAWAEVDDGGSSPVARTAHAMAYEPRSRKIILFGGIDSEFVCYNDVWAYDPSIQEWTQLSPAGDSPPARGRCSLVYAGNVDKLILFGGLVFQRDEAGGFPSQVYLNDIWTYGVDL